MSQILVELTRDPLVECVYRGDLAVVDSSGRLLYFAGDPHKITFTRSSAKPIQALNTIISGTARHFSLTDAELAVISASHYAEDFHLQVVENLLTKIGLSVNALQCPAETSYKLEQALELARRRTKITPLHCDCSGKHAGMLSVCVHKNYALDNYLALDHPVQQQILEHIAYMYQMEKEELAIGIDGCNAPVFGMPLLNMAWAFARFVRPGQLAAPYAEAVTRIYNALNNHPEMVAGTNGFCTELMKRSNKKLMAKLGAEGVYCVAIKDKGIGIALKMEDGAVKTIPPVIYRVLEYLKLLPAQELEQLKQYQTIESRNECRIKVGELRAAFTLQKA